jgi:hypothetical protein
MCCAQGAAVEEWVGVSEGGRECVAWRTMDTNLDENELGEVFGQEGSQVDTSWQHRNPLGEQLDLCQSTALNSFCNLNRKRQFTVEG